jgi:hypothetical protein
MKCDDYCQFNHCIIGSYSCELCKHYTMLYGDYSVDTKQTTFYISCKLEYALENLKEILE